VGAAKILTLFSGLLAGQWRRGSAWRVGIFDYDPETGELQSLSHVQNPVILPEAPFEAATQFAADPFLFRRGDTWYLFYEAQPPGGHGEIRAASSSDLVVWHPLGTVLRTDVHLSYPTVTMVSGHPRLVVESSADNCIRVYDPQEFPTRWIPGQVLLTGAAYADPTIVHHAGRWWIFAEVSGGEHNRLEAFWTESDEWSDWRPHPSNPLCTDNRFARPAGPMFHIASNRLFRLGQDCSSEYGRRVALLEVLRLDEHGYEERFVRWLSVPRTARSWAGLRSHQVSIVHLDDGRWLAAVDGRGYLTLRKAGVMAWRRRRESVRPAGRAR
jgi:hypothetical protein